MVQRRSCTCKAKTSDELICLFSFQLRRTRGPTAQRSMESRSRVSTEGGSNPKTRQPSEQHGRSECAMRARGGMGGCRQFFSSFLRPTPNAGRPADRCVRAPAGRAKETNGTNQRHTHAGCELSGDIRFPYFSELTYLCRKSNRTESVRTQSCDARN